MDVARHAFLAVQAAGVAAITACDLIMPAALNAFRCEALRHTGVRAVSEVTTIQLTVLARILVEVTASDAGQTIGGVGDRLSIAVFHRIIARADWLTSMAACRRLRTELATPELFACALEAVNLVGACGCVLCVAWTLRSLGRVAVINVRLAVVILRVARLACARPHAGSLFGRRACAVAIAPLRLCALIDVFARLLSGGGIGNLLKPSLAFASV
jgi:hypothetical protein